MPVHDSEIVLCNRKMSTYINALAKAGFAIEQLVEETDDETLKADGELDSKTRKAQYNILNVLFFTIAENFSIKNFSIQIEISNFARNKDKESENRILYKKRFRIRKR